MFSTTAPEEPASTDSTSCDSGISTVFSTSATDIMHEQELWDHNCVLHACTRRNLPDLPNVERLDDELQLDNLYG